MANDLQPLRRSAVISTFGPGAIVDFRAEGAPISGIVSGLEEWDKSFGPPGIRNPQVIHERRLEKKLGVKGFRLPPVLDEKNREDDSRRLVAVRFPKWLQCPRCDLIKPEKRWRGDPGKASRSCPQCSNDLPGNQQVYVVPVRFILTCKNGHVDDFPWDWWVGHKPDCTTKTRRIDRHPGLYLRSEGAGLAGLVLSCPKCGAKNSMDGVFSAKTWERAMSCSGQRPWIPGGAEECGAQPVAAQRGASNLYFPLIASALSIPPWSDRLQEAIGEYWQYLVDMEYESERARFIADRSEVELKPVLHELGMTEAQLARAIEDHKESFDNLKLDDLRPDEYRELIHDSSNEGGGGEFETRTEQVPDSIRPWIQRILRVVRLREVRAIHGFTRVNPPDDPEASDCATLSRSRLDWFPGIDVRGEGIFLAIDGERLRDWESRPAVIERAKACDVRYQAYWRNRYGEDSKLPAPVSARYMLCHTLAHLLMRQLALECGYSAASLQERIYSDAHDGQMAGILIYTATSDSDGTLGGLQRQGRSERIASLLLRALDAVWWCSSDPLCISDLMGALDNYSHSVCHACCLAPETSCEAFNCFLDRGMVLGDGDTEGLAFFDLTINTQ